MLESIKKILGIGPAVDYGTLVRQGAIILDVRSKGEYSGGHIKGSINIPVDQLKSNLSRLPDKQKPKTGIEGLEKIQALFLMKVFIANRFDNPLKNPTM